MSRKAANEKFNWKDVNRLLRERGVTLISAGLDEVPMAYKNIREVMAAQSDLVTTLGQFDPKLVKMAPSGERPKIDHVQESPTSRLEAFLSARWDLSASIRALARRLFLRFCRRIFSIRDTSAATCPVCFPSILSSNIRRAINRLSPC